MTPTILYLIGLFTVYIIGAIVVFVVMAKADKKRYKEHFFAKNQFEDDAGSAILFSIFWPVFPMAFIGFVLPLAIIVLPLIGVVKVLTYFYGKLTGIDE